MTSAQKERRAYWAKRFPEVSSDWPYWWIEGESYCLAVVEGSNLAAAVEIIEDNWENYNSIVAYNAKVIDTDLIRRRAPVTVIYSKSNTPIFQEN